MDEGPEFPHLEFAQSCDSSRSKDLDDDNDGIADPPKDEDSDNHCAYDGDSACERWQPIRAEVGSRRENQLSFRHYWPSLSASLSTSSQGHCDKGIRVLLYRWPKHMVAKQAES